MTELDLFGRPSKNHVPDRVLVLKPKEGMTAKSTGGLVDKRLFTGENNIHALMDPEYGHWYVKYDSGVVPQQLQQRWTSFNKLYEFVKNYYATRNIEIKEVIG
jgi:hypothetical protein